MDGDGNSFSRCSAIGRESFIAPCGFWVGDADALLIITGRVYTNASLLGGRSRLVKRGFMSVKERKLWV